MFSATQSITPLRGFSSDLEIRKIERPQNIEAKPACWSQNLIATLQDDKLDALVQNIYEHKGFTLIDKTPGKEFSALTFHAEENPNYSLSIATVSQAGNISIAMIKSFCDQTEHAAESVIITQSNFSSGALDYCARKPVTLISNRELLSLILKLDASKQNELLAKATS